MTTPLEATTRQVKVIASGISFGPYDLDSDVSGLAADDDSATAQAIDDRISAYTLAVALDDDGVPYVVF